MKILSIRIKNLASLSGEHFIDFESEPLASAGLVAIIGKTGAGKSTILDAMCLALFNRIPRLKDSDGKLLDADGSELATNSPLTVLRRGTAHGFAELCFIAQDQKHYLARWELKRSREKANGKLQSVQRYLKCLSDGTVVADKPKAVDSNIFKITQLSFEQFTRAVLLAQSEVTAFLKARDNERGELLEYLTDSAIFAKVGQLAYEKTKSIANQRKEIENVLGHIEILSEDDFATFNAQFEKLNHEYQKHELEKLSLQKHQQWFDQKHKFESDLQVHVQQLNNAQQNLDALAPEKLHVQQLEQFAAIRPSVIQHKNILNDIVQLKPQLEKVQHDFNHIEQHYLAEKTSFEKIELQQQQQNQFEIQHQEQIKSVRERIAERGILVDQLLKAKIDFKTLENQLIPHLEQQQQLQTHLSQLQNEIAQHTAQLEQSNHFTSLDDALSAHISQVQRFTQNYAQFEKNYGDVQHAHTQLSAQQKQLDQLNQHYGQDDALTQKISTLRTERDQIVQTLNQFSILQQQWQNFQNIEIEHEKLIQTQSSLNQQVLASETQLTHAEKHYQKQKNAREQLQKILEQQRLLNTENIEKLRAELVNGEACLVCGSTEHPYAAKDAFSDQLFKLQMQQHQQTIESEKIAFDAWQQHQTALTQQTAALKANNDQLAQLTHQRQRIQSELEPQFTGLKINFDFSQPHQLVNALIQTEKNDAQQVQKQLEDTLLAHENAQKLRHTLTNTIQQTSQHLSSVQQAEDNIQHVFILCNDSEKHAWYQSTLSTALQIADRLQQRQHTLKSVHDVTLQINQENQRLDQCRHQIKFCQEKIQSAAETIEALKISGTNNNDLAIQSIFAMTKITVEKPHEWLAAFEHQSVQLKDQLELARKRFDQARQSFDSIQSLFNKCRTENTQLHKQSDQVHHHIQQWLNQNSAFNPLMLDQISLISHAQEQQLKQRILAVERVYADLQAAIKTVQSQLNTHLEQQPNIEFNDLVSSMTTLVASMQTLAQQRDELNLKLEVHHRNVAQQHAFVTQIQKIQVEEHRWGKISGLMGDATGKKFRDYAQQYNLDLLLEHANQQLCLLSQRYTLKRLEDSLSLAIIDHDMDGETRSVASLSGGESFLTALALSLAIANMASGSMKIESLFIDEGFGTLDASSLHMVMNALDQLQSQGRKVVLISHIQDMHERIPVQIQVQPIGAGASTLEVVC